MAIYISEDEKARHPYYTIMDLRDEELLNELSKWSRYDLIEWLLWNDRNGVYRDEDSLREFDQIISREEALEIMVRQITEA
jgi:hypothetical protein